MDRIQLDQNKEKLAKAQEAKAKLEEELKALNIELDTIKKQLIEDTKEFEKIQRQYKLENFKWAVLDEDNSIEPIEFDLEKYLRQEEERKRQSEIIPEDPTFPETPIKKNLIYQEHRKIRILKNQENQEKDQIKIKTQVKNKIQEKNKLQVN